MTGKKFNRWKSSGIRGIYLLPFLIVSLYIILFAYLDRYPYDPSSADDQGLFQRVALNILGHGAFSGSTGSEKVFCPTRPPLYPMLIALTWEFTKTRSLAYIRAIQVICYFLSIFFIFRTATILTDGNTKYGFLSSLFASLVPHTAAVTHVILTESLAIFFLSLSVLLTAALGKKKKLLYLILLGFTLGFLNLQRPNFLFIPVIFIGYILFLYQKRKKDMITALVLIIIPFLCCLLPWSIYKKAEINSYSPSYAALGSNVMVGIVENSPSLAKDIGEKLEQITAVNFNRKPYYDKIGDILHLKTALATTSGSFSPDVAKLIALSALTYVEAWHVQPPPPDKVILADDFLKKTAFIWIKNNPAKFPAIMLENIKHLILPNDQPLVYQQLSGPLCSAFFVIKLVFFLFSLYGMYFLLRARRFHLVFFPLVIVLYIIIINSLMHAEPRYFIYTYLFMTMTIPVVVNRNILNRDLRGQTHQRENK